MDVFEDGVRLNVTPGKKAAADGVEAEGITGRLVLDAMARILRTLVYPRPTHVPTHTLPTQCTRAPTHPHC